MILLLENVTERAKRSEVDFQEYKNIIDTVFFNQKCDSLIDDFLKDHTIFDKYDTIMIHESIYREEERKELFEVLESYCTDKSLVTFSGNNSQALLTDVSLQLSVEDFYKNLEDFLSEYNSDNISILMLAYGKYWDLNKLLNILHELNLFIENYEDEEIDFDEFEDDFDLFELKNLLNTDEYNILFENLYNFESEIDLEQIKILASNFKKLIQEKSK